MQTHSYSAHLFISLIMADIEPYKYRPKASLSLSIRTPKPKSHFSVESKPKFHFSVESKPKSQITTFIIKMGSESLPLHVLFFPFMADGHIIPMIDIVRLVAARGVKSTIITTLQNASVLTKNTERDRNSGLDIYIQAIRFPAEEVGLPEGTENIDNMDTPELIAKFMAAVPLLQEPLKQLLEEHRPDFIVADMFFPWATDVSGELGIPRLVFHGTNCFSLCAAQSIRVHEPYRNIHAETKSFMVPGLPDQIEIKRSELPERIGSDDPLTLTMDKVRDSELKSFGNIMNSFYDLEPAYAEHYKNNMGRKAWHIGPVSLRNKDTTDKAQRGRKATVDEHYVLNWLDSRKQNSVLYICFGSMSRFHSVQLLEIALGLEKSGVSFVWVIRKTKKAEVEQAFLPEGFEERIEGKGLMIRDWAPQLLILDHQAIGGFMTHCGWNSTLEGISAGVPMITWPLFAEQFYNEKFVTQILKIGIRVGSENYLEVGSGEKEAGVKKEQVEEAVNQLMGDGEEAKEMRRKASEFKEMAKRTVEEGGSSYKNLTALIEEMRIHRETSTAKENQVKLDVVSE